MRAATQYRLIYFISIIASFFSGSHFLPETIDSDLELAITLAFAGLYFVLLPVLYWVGIIRIGQQKTWKILIALSLSALVARYTFPDDFAQYFDFIAWIRYPLVAVLLILELYVTYLVFRGLWQARKALGDPRVTALEFYFKQQDKTNKQESDSSSVVQKLKSSFKESRKDSQLATTLMFSTEPASWYYAVPYFSRNHIPSLGRINSTTAKSYHVVLMSFVLILAAFLSLSWLVERYEYVAYFAAVVSGYSLIFTIGNYRVAKHYSIYRKGNHLIVSQGLFSVSRFNIDDIAEVERSETKPEKDEVSFGKGEGDYVRLKFSKPQNYFGMMGQFTEQVEQIYLAVDNPGELIAAIKSSTRN